jgi:hypothetical protein
MRILRGASWLFAAALMLVACDAEDPVTPVPVPEAAAGLAAEHEFVAELVLKDLFLVTPGMIGETESTSTFAGRCDPAADWVAYFDITGTLPHLGRVDGSASHCAYLDPTEEHTVLYDQGSGWLRSASGEDALLDYGDGRAWLSDDGVMEFEDAWTFQGGTGRFANLRGAGTGFGTYTDQQVAAGEDMGYTIRGVMAYDAALSSGSTFRARARLELRTPYLDTGRLLEDPCFTNLNLGPGWVLVTQQGPGTGTHLGEFWLETEYCMNALTSATTERLNRGTTASGATFEILCEGNLPLFIPGMTHTYAVRTRETFTGLTGNLEGLTGVAWNSGRIEARYTPEGVPIRPGIFEVDIVGSLDR